MDRSRTKRVDLLRDVYARFRVLIHEVAKFGIVGILAFFITIGGANALHFGAGLGPLISVTIATIVATVFAFLGNGIGLLIQLAFVAGVHYGLGLTDSLAYNVANIIGVGVATVFRLYCYRRWGFMMADDTPMPEQLEPETSGT